MKNQGILISGFMVSLLFLVIGLYYSSTLVIIFGAVVLGAFILRWVEVTYLDFPYGVALLMMLAALFYVTMIILIAYGIIKVG